MRSWYQLIKQSMSETQVGNDIVVSENTRLVGAAIKYHDKIFVSACHATAWMLAMEHPELGPEITQLWEAAMEGLAKIDKYEGFMTTDGFKTRSEAAEIAQKSGQLRNKNQNPRWPLCSEDVKDWAPKSMVAREFREGCIFRTGS